jgi:metal-sulfur cluster biosynthetic enzyme
MPTLEEVEDALSNVIDPELGLDFVELGLIYGVEIDGRQRPRDLHADHARVPDRPAGHGADRRVRLRAGRGRRGVLLDGVHPPWTPEKMSEDAKFALGY